MLHEEKQNVEATEKELKILEERLDVTNIIAGRERAKTEVGIIIASFRMPRRKRGIQGNQSTATVPTLKRPPDQFAVSQLLDGNVPVIARWQGAWAANKSADWLITRSVPPLHCTLIWPSTVTRLFQRYGGIFGVETTPCWD